MVRRLRTTLVLLLLLASVCLPAEPTAAAGAKGARSRAHGTQGAGQRPRPPGRGSNLNHSAFSANPAPIPFPDSLRDQAGGAEDRVEVLLETDAAPTVGGLATLSLEARPLLDTPDLTISWIVPADVELLGPATQSLGPASAGQTLHATRQVRFRQQGTFKIAVETTLQLNPHTRFGAAGVLFFTIGAAGSRVSDHDPETISPMHTLMQTTATSAPGGGGGPIETQSDPCFTVRGNISRIDKPSTNAGRGPDVVVPVRFARLEVREEDTLFDDSYAELNTDVNGNYSASFCDDDGVFDDELEIYVRLRSEMYSGGFLVSQVEDSSYIDEVYEYDSSVVDSEGGTLTFDMALNQAQSAVFNIADAAFDAWSFWNSSGGEAGGDATFDDEAEIHWEPGYGDTGSYYDPFWSEMTVADDPSDPDAWDDSVLIHEWGHMADDQYSCDDNPGGQHFVNQLVSDPELAWGEGYPDYYQSAVRASTGAAFSSFYIDINGAGGGISIDMEFWDTTNPTLVDVLSEFGIAAALWDLNDSANDNQDGASLGHAMIQSVYTNDTFEANGDIFDDDCDFATFAKAWVADGKPADTGTAGAIKQNTGFTLTPGTLLAQTGEENSLAGLPADVETGYEWWKKVTFVADNSASMAGPKFDAVKTVLSEQLNDLKDADPQGVELSLYTFNNTNSAQAVFAGQFYPERLNSTVNGLATTGGVDGSCQVNALKALSKAVDGQYGGDAWLFTDGETSQTPSVENIKQTLLNRQLRGSFAVLGQCGSGGGQGLHGPAQGYLGLANDQTPGGIVPYLVPAIASGGQFMYVDNSQIDEAADILRAQITHSAGAGRWSDYVSDRATYRHDKLASWEYNWVDMTGGTVYGSPQSTADGYVEIAMPQPFQYYAGPYYSTVRAFWPGYLTFGLSGVVAPNNTTLPNVAPPNNTLYPFWGLSGGGDWYNICLQQESENSPQCSNGSVLSKQSGDWFAVEYAPLAGSNFQVLLNPQTREIRYQYKTVDTNRAGNATIGLENSNASDGVQVSFNDINGAKNNTGYKFVPAPPQPTKTYSVTVDSTMSGVGFLLTGYSGSFDQLAIRHPDGTTVSCADTANVLCLNLGLVQYVQADVDGRLGDWTADISAGGSGSGTFSFTSFAASALTIESIGDHSLSSQGSSSLLLNLGRAVDGNQIDARFLKPTGAAFGGGFKLFDDGAHGDGRAGDGYFGLDALTPPGVGSGYMWIEGLVDGGRFVRSDPLPYTFQPLSITAPVEGVNTGGETQLGFQIKNDDSVNHCYFASAQVPEGWSFRWPGFLGGFFCLNAGTSATANLFVSMSSSNPNTLPSGTSGEVTVSLVEWEQGIMSDSASVNVARRRPPASVEIERQAAYLRPGGDSTKLLVHVWDDQGVAVADGTLVQLSSTLGTLSAASAPVLDGHVEVTFTSGAATGDAVITADAGGGVVGTITIPISEPLPDEIVLTTSAREMLADGKATATLVATVRDGRGDPVANQLVQIGLEGDGQLGTIAGGEVISGTTDSQGRFSATLTSGTEAGMLGVRAEALIPQGAGYRVALDDRKEISMGRWSLYLPIVIR